MKFAKIFEAAEVCPFCSSFLSDSDILECVETISERTRRVFSSFFTLSVSFFRPCVLCPSLSLSPCPFPPHSLPCFPPSLLPSLNPRIYLPSSFSSVPPSFLHFLPSLPTFSLPLSLLVPLFLPWFPLGSRPLT